VFLCLSASALRWLAVPCTLLAGLAYNVPKPDILFDERAANAAILTAQGYAPALAKGASFAVGRWLQQQADSVPVAEAAKRPAWTCGPEKCLAAAPVPIAYLRRAAEGKVLCPAADIMLSEFPLRKKCKGRLVTIDRFDVWRSGAHAIFNGSGGIKVITVSEQQGERPWVYAPRSRGASYFTRKRP
jgi:competence protein ComEC